MYYRGGKKYLQAAFARRKLCPIDLSNHTERHLPSQVEAKLEKVQESDRSRKLSPEKDENVPSEEEVDKLWEGWSSAYAVDDPHFKGTPVLSAGMLPPPHLQVRLKLA